jgi:hypothetical protein
MKTLSVKNPYAQLICEGIKDIENRNRRILYRGKLLIHVTKPHSAIIGYCTVSDCIRNSQSKWALPDMWHWVLTNPILFDVPITNISGKLGLWNFPIENYPDISIL